MGHVHVEGEQETVIRRFQPAELPADIRVGRGGPSGLAE